MQQMQVARALPMRFKLTQGLVLRHVDEVIYTPDLQGATLVVITYAHHRVWVARVPLEIHYLHPSICSGVQVPLAKPLSGMLC